MPARADRRDRVDDHWPFELCQYAGYKDDGPKKEFAVYQSLGMTGRQLQWLLLTEGLLHGTLLIVILLPVTFFVTWFGMPAVFSQLNTWCMTYHYTLAPLWVALLFILFLAVAV